jgi:hypothetical protein
MIIISKEISAKTADWTFLEVKHQTPEQDSFQTNFIQVNVRIGSG